MKLTFARALLASAMLVSGPLLISAGSVSAAGPTAERPPVSSGELTPREWTSIKKNLDASKLPKSTSVVNGVRTIAYTLPTGSMLTLSEPAGGTPSVAPQASVGGCDSSGSVCG